MGTLQAFLAEGALKAAQDLEAALLRLPEETRSLSAGGTARTALDMVAEVAILNGTTAEIIEKQQGMNDLNLEVFAQEKAALAKDWKTLQTLLDKNTRRVAQAIRAVPDNHLEVEVPMPWGPMTLTQVMSYPYWNASYHEGQINFIASMQGDLK